MWSEVDGILGIDPGQSGGLAIVSLLGEVEAIAMPFTERDIWDWISALELKGKVVATIEKVHSMPGQGVASTFKFGVGYGGLRMALIAARIPFEEVTPRVWQKGLGISSRKKTESKTQFKNRLKAKAQQLFPAEERITLKIADALLIAEFGRRKYREML